MPLTQLVQRNRGLLVELYRDPHDVDRIRWGHVSGPQRAAAIHFSGLPRGTGQGRQAYILLNEDDIPSCLDLFFEAGYIHKVRGLGSPVRVRDGVPSQVGNVDPDSRRHRLTGGRGPVGRRGCGVERSGHRDVAR